MFYHIEIFQMGIKDWNVIHIILIIIAMNFDSKSVDNTYELHITFRYSRKYIKFLKASDFSS